MREHGEHSIVEQEDEITELSTYSKKEVIDTVLRLVEKYSTKPGVSLVDYDNDALHNFKIDTNYHEIVLTVIPLP